jgi:hypothetical protein
MVIKSRMMRLAGHVARMRKTRNAYRIFVGKSERRNDSEDLDVDGKIILKVISRK